MMRILFRLLIVSILLFQGISELSAQLAPQLFTVDTIVHYGAGADGVDLTGYITYDIYVVTANGTTRVSSIYGDTPVDPQSDTLQYDGIPTPDEGDAWIYTPCGTFQHENCGWVVSQNLCVTQNFFASAKWDSFCTVKYLCTPAASNINNVLLPLDQASTVAWENDNTGTPFDGGDTLRIDNGGWFCFPTDDAAIPVNNEVRVMRITTCGDLSTCFNVQYFPNYAGPASPSASQRICVDITNPCLSNPMDTTPISGAVGCFGDLTQVALSDGGNGPVEYQLHSGGVIGAAGDLVSTYPNETNGLVIPGLAVGQYYFTMIDHAGCRDTSAVVDVTVPEQMVLSVDVVQDILCFGDSDGQIQLTCGGGTGTIDLAVNGTGGYTCGQLMTDLSCGDYAVIAIDENGCSLDTLVSISCPTQMVMNLTGTDVTCFGYHNGAINGNVTGGTGTLTAQLVLGGEVIQTATGTSPFAIHFITLDGGDYTISVVDQNGCQIEQLLTLQEPDLFTITATPSAATCFGYCNGSVAWLIEGGSGAPIPVVTNAIGIAQNPALLCAGSFTIAVTDPNGCIASDSFDILEPADIAYLQGETAVSCFGMCDGQISITDVVGGTGSYSYALSPNTGLCLPPCGGSSVSYSNLCSGTYSITITDDAGCTKPITGIVIGSPTQLEISILSEDVSCFGLSDGNATVSATGGTGDIVMTPGDLVLPALVEDLAPGTYTYTVLDENGCAASDDVIITQPDLLQGIGTDTSNVSCGGSCDGVFQYVVSGGTSPYIYQYSTGGNPGVADGDLTGLCADDYIVYLIDNHDCRDTLQFTISEPPPLFIDLLLDGPGCTGMTNGSAQVTVGGGQGPLSVTFTPPTLDITSAGQYSYVIHDLGETVFRILLHDSVGCNMADTVVVLPDIVTDMVLEMFTSPESCWNTNDGTATVAVQNGHLPIAYYWSDPANQPNATAVGLEGSEQYTVIVTDAIGCTLTEHVTVEPTLGCFFISTALTPNGDGVNDTWLLGGMEYFPTAKIQVFNVWGQVVFESTGYSNPWNGTFQGQQLPVADYYFVINYSDEEDPILGTVTIKY